MAVIKAKPTSPGRRGVISIKSDLHKGKPHKALLEKKSKNGGRNNNGRITVRHQGVVTSSITELLILKEINLISQQLLRPLNMIQIDQLTWHSLNMQMEKDVTSLLQVKLKLETLLYQQIKLK
jgi:hypothetical protein